MILDFKKKTTTSPSTSSIHRAMEHIFKNKIDALLSKIAHRKGRRSSGKKKKSDYAIKRKRHRNQFESPHFDTRARIGNQGCRDFGRLSS